MARVVRKLQGGYRGIYSVEWTGILGVVKQSGCLGRFFREAVSYSATSHFFRPECPTHKGGE